MVRLVCLISIGLFLNDASAFTLAPSKSAFTTTTSLAVVNDGVSSSRKQFINHASAVVAAMALPTIFPQSAIAAADGDVVELPSGVSYKILKVGDGPQPNIGELAGIRFRAFAGENKIDDIFETPEPYYTRIGAGALIKGVEEVLPKMSVGDRYILTIPVRPNKLFPLTNIFVNTN